MRNEIRAFDANLDEDYNELYHRLEEKLSEIDWRTLGGFGTEDLKFAETMRETVKEQMYFLERLEEVIDRVLVNSKEEVDDAEYRATQAEKKLGEGTRIS